MKEGSTPKILLLCHPNNPTGRIYSNKILKMCIEWAKSKEMHIICDEIYGNSIFPGEKFSSIAKVMRDQKKCDDYLGEYVHIAAGFSKDFALSGSRVGILLTHNKELLEAVDSLGYFKAVSNHT